MRLPSDIPRHGSAVMVAVLFMSKVLLMALLLLWLLRLTLMVVMVMKLILALRVHTSRCRVENRRNRVTMNALQADNFTIVHAIIVICTMSAPPSHSRDSPELMSSIGKNSNSDSSDDSGAAVPMTTGLADRGYRGGVNSANMQLAFEESRRSEVVGIVAVGVVPRRDSVVMLVKPKEFFQKHSEE